MMRSPALVPGLALAGLVLPVALVSAPAQSADRVVPPHAPALKTATATFETTPSGFEVATAVCPKGQHVVAGGFSGSGNDFAVYNRAVRKKTAWRVKGEFSDGAVAYAYCSKSMSVRAKANTTSASAETAAAYDNVASTAKCPKGFVVVAGGWQVKPIVNNTPIYTSAPKGKRKWTVVAVHDSGLPWKLKTYAYCLDPKLDRDLSVATQSAAAPNGGAEATVTATCESGRIVGGGFATTPEPDFNNDTGPDTFFFRSRNVGKKTHTASGINYSHVDGTVTAYAVCLG